MLPTTSAQSGLPSFIRRAIGGISTAKQHCVYCCRCASQLLSGSARLALVLVSMSAGRPDPAPIRHKSCIEAAQYYSLLNLVAVYAKIKPPPWSQSARVEGVLLFLFRLGSPLLMAVGQGSLFGLILSEVVVDVYKRQY